MCPVRHRIDKRKAVTALLNQNNAGRGCLWSEADVICPRNIPLPETEQNEGCDAQSLGMTDNEFISIIAKLRREGMKVILKDSIYEMDRKQFHGVLEIAKKSAQKAIYSEK